MSLGRSMWVSCDGDRSGCDAEVVLMGADATTRKVRAEARRLGWAYIPRGGPGVDVDLCPEHRDTSVQSTATPLAR